jgi:hypothetical protein
MKPIIAWLLLAASIFAGTIRTDVDDSEYISYGSNFKCVIMIVGNDIDNIEKPCIGSGVIISPHWVITAAHVADSMINHQVIINEKTHSVKEVIKHPEFDKDKKINSVDLALCFIEEEIVLDDYPELYNEENEKDQECSIAGFGNTGTGETGAFYFDSNLRAGTNKISIILDDMLFCTMSKEDPTNLEFLIANGDSGGGLFINNKLAGINSIVSAFDKKADSNYGDIGGHARITKQVTWIKKIIKK